MKTWWRRALVLTALAAVALAAISGASLISLSEALGPDPPDRGTPGPTSKPPIHGWRLTGDSELRLVDQREGIAFEHSRYQQYANDLPIEGTFVTEHIDKRTDAVVSVTDRAVKLPATLAVQPRVDARQAGRIAEQRVGLLTPRGDIDSELVYLPLDDQLRLTWKITLPALEPLGDWLVYVDALDGKVLKVQDLIRYECTIPPPSPGGCVFDPNPVVEQCSWAGLADNGDADSPLLTSLRVGVGLPGLQTSANPLGQLIGEYVDLTAPGIHDAYLPAGVCQESSFVYDTTRSDDCFEEVMCYYHVDAVQRKVQDLGFTGPKAIYDSPIPIHAHYMPDANAFYSGWDRGLHFGDGGVDLAEDGDVIVHEYGHALLDDQVPGIATYEGACIHEGFADVLSALVFFEHNCDEACLGEWVNAAAQSCFRRTDSTKHYPEDMGWWDPHEDGEIWSGAIWGLFEALGGDLAARDKVLTLVLEGHFFLDPSSGLRDAASAVMAADEGLYGGADVSIIEAVFAGRGLVALPAPNDDFDDAILVEPLPFTDFHDTGDATVAEDDPPISCVGGYGHTVWHRLNVPVDMTVNLDTFSSTYDTVLAVYTGTRGALTEEVCNDDSDSLQSFVSLSAVGGVTYHIMLASYGGGPGGSLTFHAIAPPPNDNLADAAIIPGKPFDDSLSTDGATTESGEPQPCGAIAGKSGRLRK
jgi:hypothetical protein